MKKFNKSFILMLLCAVLLITNVGYVSAATFDDPNLLEENDNPKIVSITENTNPLIEKLETAKSINQEMVEELSKLMDIQSEKKEDGTIQFTFVEKSPSKIILYDNMETEETYKIIGLLALPTTSEWKGSELNNSDVILRGTMYYNMYTYKDKSGSFTCGKITKGTAQLVRNKERFGRNLRLKFRSTGHRYDANGNFIGQGSEGWKEFLVASPKEGTDYTRYPAFNYFYQIDVHGLLGMNVTYDISHNGSTYYTYTLEIRKGDLFFPW